LCFPIEICQDFIYIHAYDNSCCFIMIIESVALFIGLAAIALVFGYTLLTGSPPTPTSPRVCRTMMSVLPKRLPHGDGGREIYELGSGWGGNAITLAATFPDHHVTGIELSPIPWMVARLRLMGRPRANLSFVRGDFLMRDLSGAALVVCYLAGGQMISLRPKLEAELAPGSLILTHTFAMPGWQPVDTVHANDIYRSPVYLYEFSGAVASASQAAT
jgi:hypothetical protein